MLFHKFFILVKLTAIMGKLKNNTALQETVAKYEKKSGVIKPIPKK